MAFSTVRNEFPDKMKYWQLIKEIPFNLLTV